MPQMAPLNWLTLMMLFSMVFIMFNIVNYYSTTYKIKKTESYFEKTIKNWKW